MLDLDKNFIGEIPSGITLPPGGSRLAELYLSSNEIVSIPNELFQLQNMTNLWLSNNKISSPLPAGLGMMRELVVLDLEHNFFTGTIPSNIYSLLNLQELYLYDNILTGKFSPFLSQLASLEILDLSSNYLSGEIPTQIGSLTQLTELQ
jgi:Leucine-rich repeat (LRR) protein